MAHVYRPTCIAASLLLAFGSNVHAVPTGGVVSAGGASIAGGAGSTTITQSTQNVAINWQSFSIGQNEAVRFIQPNSSSVALNRVLGADPSSIMGTLSANGKVFLVNPNGILFGKGAQVNVGALVASTRNITDSDFMAGNYKFAGSGGGTVVNEGSINANGGYVALLGASVSNEGVISARLGTVALAAGNALTLDVAGDGLLNVVVNQGAVNALVQNGGLIRADGGQVLLTAKSAGNLLQSAVNNTGIIQAQTVENHNGTIRLMGDMQSGTVNVAGTLDASAPNGGNGGFIETSAANVYVANGAKITTAAPLGLTGTFLIDPQDFIIGGLVTDNISGVTLSALLVNNSVIIVPNIGPDTSVVGTPFTRNTSTPGNGDIFVNDAVSWTSAVPLLPNSLTLNAARDVNVNAAITGVDGNLVVCCGRDINVTGAITTTRGSILLSAGRNANLGEAITTTNGNLTICAGHDVNVNGLTAALTVTNGTVDPVRSLGLSRGLVLSAGNDGTGPGVAGGTVVFALVTPLATVTAAPAVVNYNPVSYTMPTDYSVEFIPGTLLVQHMLVFPDGAGKIFDGTSSASFSSLKGNPAGVTLVAGPGSTATFDSPDAGTGKTITFSGYSLAGPDAGNFALPVTCCGPLVGRTTGNIAPAQFAVFPVLPVLPALAGLFPGLAGLDLGVLAEGIAMPPTLAFLTPPEETGAVAKAIEEVPVVVPPVAPPPVYLPPQRPRRPDRN